MKRSQKLLAILLMVMALGMALAVSSNAADPTPLARPRNLSWNSATTASWDAVEHADHYEVELLLGGNKVDTAVQTNDTSFDFSGKMTESGTYTFRVTAISYDTDYANSSTATSGEKSFYKISYNWGTVAPAELLLPSSQVLQEGSSYTVDSTFQPTSYEGTDAYGTHGEWTFTGWKLPGATSPVTNATDTFLVDTDVTLTGAWSFTPLCTLTLDAANGTFTYDNGSAAPETITVLAGTAVELPRNGLRGTDSFAGWYISKDDSKVNYDEKVPSDSPYVLTSNITLHALWLSNAAPDDPKEHFAYYYGYEDGTVHPEGAVTRAEAATIFYRLENLTGRQSDRLTDVPETSWYYTEVTTMTAVGYLTGYTDNTFRGSNSITRAEFIALAVRIAGYDLAVQTPPIYSDVSGHWAEPYIGAASKRDLVSGYPDGTFRPNQTITRAEAATILNKLYNRGDAGQAKAEDLFVGFPDNTPDKWYYNEILNAANTHFVRVVSLSWVDWDSDNEGTYLPELDKTVRQMKLGT